MEDCTGRSDAFKRIDAMIATFLASIPREYQFTHRPIPGVAPDVLTETRLCLTHAMSHNATILLHEPWVNSISDQDEGMRKCLTSANEILNTIFVIIGAIVFLLPPEGSSLLTKARAPQARRTRSRACRRSSTFAGPSLDVRSPSAVPFLISD